MPDYFANLIPQPRKIAIRPGTMGRPRRLRLSTQGLDAEQAETMARLAKIVLGDWLGGAGPAVALQLRLDPKLTTLKKLGDEAYELTITRSLALAARSLAGLQRGIQTVRQVLEDAAAQGPIPRCRILDWPRIAHRGIHYDLAREMECRIKHLRRVIENVAYFRMNTLHLYLENKFAYPSAPTVSPPGAMTPREARELVEYARGFGVTVIPQIATMGHVEHFLHGPYECLREDPKNSFNLCPSHPKTRPFLAGLIRDVAEAFRPPYIHVGYDESHSGVCPRCQKRGSPPEILADHLNWLDEQVKSHGARTMIYADKFLSREDFPRTDAINGGTPAQAHAAIARVNRDILITDWHYTSPYGDTVRYLVREGFEVHLATATNIYWHDSIPYRRGHKWLVDSIDNGIAQGAVGAFNCNWEFYRGQFLDNYWFFEALSAERYWTDRPHDFLTYSSRFSRRFWGVDKDYYGNLASLAETTPTERRKYFLDSEVLPDLSWQMRFDFIEIGDDIIAQVKALRKAARRNADTLRLLDMPGVICRYMGQRAIGKVLLDQALAAGDKAKAIAALKDVRKVAQEVAARLEEGYRVYGGAVVDRERIAAHIRALDARIAAVRAGKGL